MQVSHVVARAANGTDPLSPSKVSGSLPDAFAAQPGPGGGLAPSTPEPRSPPSPSAARGALTAAFENAADVDGDNTSGGPPCSPITVPGRGAASRADVSSPVAQSVHTRPQSGGADSPDAAGASSRGSGGGASSGYSGRDSGGGSSGDGGGGGDSATVIIGSAPAATPPVSAFEAAAQRLPPAAPMAVPARSGGAAAGAFGSASPSEAYLEMCSDEDFAADVEKLTLHEPVSRCGFQHSCWSQQSRV